MITIDDCTTWLAPDYTLADARWLRDLPPNGLGRLEALARATQWAGAAADLADTCDEGVATADGWRRIHHQLLAGYAFARQFVGLDA